jgi:hypothetical protein
MLEWIKASVVATNGTAKLSREISGSNVEDGAYHCTMACLAWIVLELGSATSFPKVNIIPQKPQREEDHGCWLGRAQPIRDMPRRHSSSGLAIPELPSLENGFERATE